jgi:hypothetical protein
MFLDADGNKLMKHSGARSPKAFADTFAKVEDYLELVKKAEAGDAAAATDLFLMRLGLDWYELDEARKLADGLTKVSSSQKKEIAQLLIDVEVRGLAKDSTKRVEAGKRFAEMFGDKEIPAGQSELYSFWTILADHAEAERDKKLFKKVVTEFEKTIPSSGQSRKVLKELEQRLENFPKK